MEPVVIIGPSAKHLWTYNQDFLEPINSVPVLNARFPSGESYCQIQDNIRGKDVYIIQSICAPANDNLMDLLVMADAARRASAGRLTAVIPFFGYMRQDRKDKPRVPISAKLVIDMLECAGFDRIITLDVHTLQAQGFTNIPFDHLFGYPLFHSRFNEIKENSQKFVIVSPDIGGIKRAQAYSETYGVGFAIVNKKRLSPNETKPISLIGDVEGADVIITDDLTESCGTIIGAATICKEHGAASVRASVTHACLHEEGLNNLDRALSTGLLDEFITTNTVYAPRLEHMVGKTTIIDSMGLFLRSIRCTNRNESVTQLFDLKGY